MNSNIYVHHQRHMIGLRRSVGASFMFLEYVGSIRQRLSFPRSCQASARQMSRYTATSDTFAPEVSSVSSLPVRYFETVHKSTVSMTTV